MPCSGRPSDTVTVDWLASAFEWPRSIADYRRSNRAVVGRRPADSRALRMHSYLMMNVNMRLNVNLTADLDLVHSFVLLNLAAVDRPGSAVLHNRHTVDTSTGSLVVVVLKAADSMQPTCWAVASVVEVRAVN